MAESFENLDDIYPDWAKDNVKSLDEAINRYEKQEEERKKTFLFTNLLESSEPNQTQMDQSGSTDYFDNVMTKFIVNNKTDA